jgi:hypothetical protein
MLEDLRKAVEAYNTSKGPSQIDIENAARLLREENQAQFLNRVINFTQSIGSIDEFNKPFGLTRIEIGQPELYGFDVLPPALHVILSDYEPDKAIIDIQRKQLDQGLFEMLIIFQKDNIDGYSVEIVHTKYYTHVIFTGSDSAQSSNDRQFRAQFGNNRGTNRYKEEILTKHLNIANKMLDWSILETTRQIKTMS